MRNRLIVLLGMWACACAGSETGSTAVAAKVADDPEPHRDPEPPREPEPPRDPERPREPTAPKLGRDHRSVVACTTNADCGWDDSCVPERCVEPDAPEMACEESAPPPGECLCVEGACTVRPDKEPPPSEACERHTCVVDRAAGRCVVDTSEAEGLRTSPPVDIGPSCDCPVPGEPCKLSWFDAVPCKTDRDCWIDLLPRTHPVARPKALRKRDFKPCADGTTAPKCGDAGRCVIGPTYKC